MKNTNPSHFQVLGLDADDTLWHTEHLYRQSEERFVQMLCRYADPDWINTRLYQAETRNLQHFGYGIKSFTLSMIETAIELTDGRISGQDIQRLIDQAKEMLDAEVELIEHASQAVATLAQSHTLMLITKGDLMDQESKIARSGLEPYFQSIEVVSDKNGESYQRLLRRHSIDPHLFMMVGNSLRSDILPVLELGSTAVYIPYPTTWLHEAADLPAADTPGFYQLEHLGQLPELIRQLEQPAASLQ
jgi:putative hydrolase of the HAD superfamily